MASSEQIETGLSRLKTYRVTDDWRTILGDCYDVMRALEPAPEVPEPASLLPWLNPAPTGKHLLSDRLSAFLWNYGSDRPGNFNMMATYSVYRLTPADTTFYTVSCGRGNMNNQKLAFRGDWNASPHSDKQLIVFTTDGWVCEFYNASVNHSLKKITATRGDKLAVDLMQNPGSRGVGIPYHHMLITDEEIKAGKISHALSMRVGNPHCTQAWFPASKVEGTVGCHVDGIPEGARYKFSFTPERISAWAASKPETLRPLCRAIAEALQTYGAFVTDNGAGFHCWDVQHPQSWSNDNPLKAAASSNWFGTIQNLTDGLVQMADISLCEEIGDRITT